MIIKVDGKEVEISDDKLRELLFKGGGEEEKPKQLTPEQEEYRKQMYEIAKGKQNTFSRFSKKIMRYLPPKRFRDGEELPQQEIGYDEVTAAPLHQDLLAKGYTFLGDQKGNTEPPRTEYGGIGNGKTFRLRTKKV